MRKLIDLPLSGDTVADTPSFVTTGAVGKSTKHESAIRQVQGQARYVDDLPEPPGLCHAAVGLAQVTCGKIRTLDVAAVRASAGVIDVITVGDVPGHTDIGPVFKGDPILADGEILFHGQPLFAVLADSVALARQAASRFTLDVDAATPDLTAQDAKTHNRFVRPPHFIRHGNIEAGMAKATHIAEGELTIGGQEHFYLEGQIAMAVPEEEDRILIYTSSQHPSEVQKLVAEVLDIKLHKVTVDMRRMGGGFGGKESQAAQWACLAAVLAVRNRCPVKLRLPRTTDMMITGKRHPFENRFCIGFDDQGVFQAAQLEVNGICGYSPDLSDAIVDRAMFHVDNGYYLGDCDIVGHRCRTSMVSHTAFRGFGGPQGMIMAEAMIDAIARHLGEDPLTIRQRNLYGDEGRNVTPYGMPVEHNLLPDLMARLETSSRYWERRATIREFNRTSPIIKKGLALTPVKFGISFTAQHLNQAGALLHVYTDGSIQINHGGTEMGQGLHTKVAQIVAHEFGLPVSMIDVTSTRTDKVPNTTPTAASSGTDLNGKAAQNACLTIKQRLAELYAAEVGGDAAAVEFANEQVRLGSHSIPFVDLVQKAFFARVSLSATGYYKTPKIHYDRATGKGRPFFYFAYGASCSEVEVDTLTGEYQVKAVDILHDVGHSLNPAIDIGQIEGGFIQGMGWLTSEELKWDGNGRLMSNNPATYKIPAIGDTPEHFNVALYPRANDEDTIYHSKAVGEPPFMLALSVWCALKDAISSLGDYRIDPQLDTPATPERVLFAIDALLAATEKTDA